MARFSKYTDMYDGRGYYLWDGAAWNPIPNGPSAVPGASVATQISARLGWINTTVPEPGTLLLLVAAAIGLLAVRRIKS